MFPLLSPGPASEALLALARDRSGAEELQCHCLLSLFEATDVVRRTLRQELARRAHTEPGFNVLACLLSSSSECVTTKELASRAGLSPNALGTVLARLEMSGLIARELPRSGRRLQAIKITARGRAAFLSAASYCLATICHAMSTLAPDDLSALDRSCTTLRQLSSHTNTLPHHPCAMSPSAAASSRETASSSP